MNPNEIRKGLDICEWIGQQDISGPAMAVLYDLARRAPDVEFVAYPTLVARDSSIPECECVAGIDELVREGLISASLIPLPGVENIVGGVYAVVVHSLWECAQ